MELQNYDFSKKNAVKIIGYFQDIEYIFTLLVSNLNLSIIKFLSSKQIYCYLGTS